VGTGTGNPHTVRMYAVAGLDSNANSIHVVAELKEKRCMLGQHHADADICVCGRTRI
jgi:hypothetical protein